MTSARLARIGLAAFALSVVLGVALGLYQTHVFEEVQKSGFASDAMKRLEVFRYAYLGPALLDGAAAS